MPLRTKEEILAAELYHSYMRGWRDGASARRMDERFVGHRRTDMAKAYEEGYHEGCINRADVAATIARRYGHAPSLLRSTARSGTCTCYDYCPEHDHRRRP